MDPFWRVFGPFEGICRLNPLIGKKTLQKVLKRVHFGGPYIPLMVTRARAFDPFPKPRPPTILGVRGDIRNARACVRACARAREAFLIICHREHRECVKHTHEKMCVHILENVCSHFSHVKNLCHTFSRVCEKTSRQKMMSTFFQVRKNVIIIFVM